MLMTAELCVVAAKTTFALLSKSQHAGQTATFGSSACRNAEANADDDREGKGWDVWKAGLVGTLVGVLPRDLMSLARIFSDGSLAVVAVAVVAVAVVAVAVVVA